jgi:UDP-4-amino-4-deoxy-L-arabinose formyltransferase/UDP-glucuronic acid dehydrogenase (UDP-4-keto-hexauronic acid decarboxylating)
VTDPYPGAFALMEKGGKIIIWWAKPESVLSGKEPGDIEISGDDVFVITGHDAIRFLDVEIQGKRMRCSQIREYFRKGRVIKLK